MTGILTGDIAPLEFTIRIPKSPAPSLAAAVIQEAISRHSSRPESEQVYLHWLLTHPQAPEETLLRLCEQGLYLDDLGHRQGPRSLLEMLAFRHHYPEAVLTLGKQIYANPAESPSVLRDFLLRQSDERWLFESLARQTASSLDKEQVFLDSAFFGNTTSRRPQRVTACLFPPKRAMIASVMAAKSSIKSAASSA
jgi:hypothetical protein